MNPILEKWLADRQAEEKKARESFLIKQGLVDPTKTTTVFYDVTGTILTEEEAKESIRISWGPHENSMKISEAIALLLSTVREISIV